MRRRLVLFTFCAALLVSLGLLVPEALARVGGGESYGGSGGRGGGGGGGDDGAAAILWLLLRLVELTIRYPAIGIPIDLVVVGVAAYWYYGKGNVESRSSAAALSLQESASERASLSRRLAKLREADPTFSVHPFLDFVGLLYTRFQEARGSGRFEHLAAHLAPEVLAGLRPEAEPRFPRLTGVENVVVGAARIVDVREAGPQEVAIVVEFEANFTEVWTAKDGEAGRRDLYAHERWTFVKGRATPSKPPEAIGALRCPSCGAADELTLEGRCRHCGQVVNTGRFHWTVRSMQSLEKREKRPFEVTEGGGVEAGTNLPTVFAPDLQARRHAFEAENPDFRWDELDALVRRTFLELQAAWTAMQWQRARAFETDHLFETHRFWIERYRQAGLNNRVEDVSVDRVTVVKVEQDAFFDAVTVRIWAAVLDYTVDRQGRVVAGSKDRPRKFSEYWTFIRRVPAQRRPTAQPRDPASEFSCPSCGAPLQMTQTAVCEYCGAKVTSGEFGWVLSLIDQDEAYAG